MRMVKRVFSVELFVLKLSPHKIIYRYPWIPCFTKTAESDKGPLSEVEMDISSKSDTTMFNSMLKHFQVLYCVFC